MARSTRTTSRKKKALTVDFKGVEGKQARIPDGEYSAKVAEVSQEEGQQADYLKWTFELDGGDFDGRKLFLNTSLSAAALWNLRGVLEAIGVEVPDDELDLDFEDFVGRSIGLSVETETYEGKKRSKIADYFAAEAVEEEDDEPKSKKKRAARDDDDDDEPKKMTRAEKRRAAKAKAEEDDDEDDKPARKSRRSRDEDEDEDEAPKSRKSRRNRDDEEDEEDDKPARGKKSSKKSKGVSEDEVNDMNEEELEELIEEHDLGVDLTKSKTLTKKRNVTIDALSEAGVI